MATVSCVPWFSQQILGLDGKPLVNGKLVFFKNRTDIPCSVYTSDGLVALGNEITLDSSGFPSTQFALLAEQEYSIKVFDENNVMIFSRNDVGSHSSGEGHSEDYVPMSGTTEDDPVRGPLVWKDGDYENSTDAYGTTLTNEQGGSTVFDRSGLAVRMANDSGEYGATSLKIQNTQNGFPGYPNKSVLNDNSLTITKEVAGDGGVRVEKQVEMKVASSNLSLNQLNFKGNTNIETEGGYLLVNSLSGLINITGKGIELNTSDSSKVVVGSQSKFIAKTFGIGTSLNNKEVNDIWTSTSTGTPLDSQLITAKAALGAGGGPKVWENTQLLNTQMTFTNNVLAQNDTISLGWICNPSLDKVKSLTFYFDKSTKTPDGFKAAIYKRAYSGITDPTAYTMDGPVLTYDMGDLGTRVAYKDGSSIPWSGSSFHTISFDEAVEIDPEYLYTFVLEFGMANADVSGPIKLGGGPSISNPYFGTVVGVGGVGLPATLALEQNLQTRVGWAFNSFSTMDYTATCNNFWIKMASE